MSQFIVSIDQGTTGTTVIIMDQAGSLVAKVKQDYRQIFPRPGWVEHDPEDIWQSVVSAVKKSLQKSQIKPMQIAAIGITNQRETVLVWNRKTGKPIYNAIVWQCRRTQADCLQLKKRGFEKMMTRKTGLVLDPYFSATKINWILKNVKGAREQAKKGQLAVGTVDTYLLWKLTGGAAHKTDLSNASRTMLLNIHRGDWDADLLKLFSIDRDLLPDLATSSGIFGKTEGLGFLPDGIPIAGIAGDQQAALFGQTCFQVGEAKCTFGTGSFLLLNTGNQPIVSKRHLLTTIAWQLPNEKITYALEGGAFVCGAAIQWLRDGLGLIKTSDEIESLAQSVTSTDGVEFVPALTGMGAPYWWPEARGQISGITRGTKKAHIARATLEAMALQNCDILFSMQKDLGKKLKSLKVDGGASENQLLMQLQADYMGMKVSRPKNIETTAIGAAYLAGLGIGLWTSKKEIQKIWQQDRDFKSKMSAKERSLRLAHWHQAVQQLQQDI